MPSPTLHPAAYTALVDLALREDLGPEGVDLTTAWLVPAQAQATATIIARRPGVVAGLEVAGAVFNKISPQTSCTPRVEDGAALLPGQVLLELAGPARAILTGERTALNFLQRLSGIATLTRQFVDAAAGRLVVLDTRKTTPLLRVFEKYAVRAGGGSNHRNGLDDGILIKDNHVRLAGGVVEAVTRMKKFSREMPTEVEVQSLDEVNGALEAGADILLLDNMSTPDIIEAVRRCQGRARTEISGGVTLARMPELAATGADYVSIGALTHSAPAIDLSVDIEPA